MIRGVGLSNDGRGRGLLAPSEEGRCARCAAAYADGRASPGGHLAASSATPPAPRSATPPSCAAWRAGLRRRAAACRSARSSRTSGHLITAAGVAGADQGARRARAPGAAPDAPRRGAARGARRRAVPAAAASRALARAAGRCAPACRDQHLRLRRQQRAPDPRGVDGAAAALARRRRPRAGPPAPAIAIVALAVRTGAGAGATFCAAAARGPARPRTTWARRSPRATWSSRVPACGSRPSDLRAALAQQTCCCRWPRHARRAREAPPRAHRAAGGHGVRRRSRPHGTRWRLASRASSRLRRAATGPDWPAPALHGGFGAWAACPTSSPTGSITSWTSPGPASPSRAEEPSGVVALELAARALRARRGRRRPRGRGGPLAASRSRPPLPPPSPPSAEHRATRAVLARAQAPRRRTARRRRSDGLAAGGASRWGAGVRAEPHRRTTQASRPASGMRMPHRACCMWRRPWSLAPITRFRPRRVPCRGCRPPLGAMHACT